MYKSEYLRKKKLMLFLGFYYRIKLIIGRAQKVVNLKRSLLVGQGVSMPLP